MEKRNSGNRLNERVKEKPLKETMKYSSYKKKKKAKTIKLEVKQGEISRRRKQSPHHICERVRLMEP